MDDKKKVYDDLIIINLYKEMPVLESPTALTVGGILWLWQGCWNRMGKGAPKILAVNPISIKGQAMPTNLLLAPPQDF